jgi:hypothetical protein
MGKKILSGQQERIYVEFRDVDNKLVDPTNPRVVVYNPLGEQVVSSAACTFEAVGVYFYNFTASTAYATERGVYQAWFEGYINGALITMDDPVYFDVIDIPIIYSSTSVGRSFVRSVRNAIGDTYEDAYLIATEDINYYVQDGVGRANSVYDFGYNVVISTAGNDRSGRIDFQYGGQNADLLVAARNWYLANTVKMIMEAQVRLNVFGTGNINAGDINFNLATGLRAQTEYLKLLNEDLNKLEFDLKINGASGVLINNYSIADLEVSEY